MDLQEMVDQIAAAVARLDASETRQLIAIAGPPASGKSTLAELVQTRLNAQGTSCGLVPMDGFHLDNSVLSAHGTLERKGAPETFDVQGFADLMRQLHSADDVPIPLFDRDRDCVDEGAGRIQSHERLVVVEGNYLFLDQPGWRDLRGFWALSVFLRPQLAVLEERLVQRWLDHGHSLPQAKERTARNDLINAQAVLEESDFSAIDILL